MNDDSIDKPSDDMVSEPWEKKSERFEVRLPFSKKQAFVQACEEQGDTPSDAVRRFIHTYLRRANEDNTGMARRVFQNRLRQNLAFGFTGVFAIGAVVMFGPQSCATIESNRNLAVKKALFAQYDKNNDTVLSPGEVKNNDTALHEVLDVNDSGGITFDEFITDGRMQLFLKAIEPKTNKTDHTEPFKERRLVVFDLNNPEKVILSSWLMDAQNKAVGDKMDRLIFRDEITNEFDSFLSDASIQYDGKGEFVSITFAPDQSNYGQKSGASDVPNSGISEIEMEREVSLEGQANGNFIMKADSIKLRADESRSIELQGDVTINEAGNGEVIITATETQVISDKL